VVCTHLALDNLHALTNFRYEEDVFVVPNDASPDDMKRGLSVLQELASLRVDRRWDRSHGLNNHTLPQICLSPDNCFFALEPELPEVQSLLNEVRLSWEYAGTFRHNPYAEPASIVPRARTSVVKLPNNKRTKFLASTYYTVADLAGKGRKFWANGGVKAAAKICLKNAALFQARQLSREFFRYFCREKLHF
jgi:hypothetical protein